MKITILGGAGAMGAIYGGRLASAGHEVTLIDVNKVAIDHINQHGVKVQDKTGNIITARARATDTSEGVGIQDYVVVFTKCYHTEGAVTKALPLIGPNTVVVSLQNGWGNAKRIQSIVGDGKVFCGVTYNSGQLLGLGHTLQGGVGMTHIGELSGGSSRQRANIEGQLAPNLFQHLLRLSHLKARLLQCFSQGMHTRTAAAAQLTDVSDAYTALQGVPETQQLSAVVGHSAEYLAVPNN